MKSSRQYQRRGDRPDKIGPVAVRGFTLVELLVVVSIIGILVALLFPALSAARASAQKTECQNNLRQIGVAFLSHAERNGAYCSGVFDWVNEGAVTEVGWVADSVDQGVPVGQMLCPANLAKVSEVYNQLLTKEMADFTGCVDGEGSDPTTAPDGTAVINPCRRILNANYETNPATSMPYTRAEQIAKDVLEKNFNTNYVASWLLVRSRPRLDSDGNLLKCKTSGDASLKLRESTAGPLSLAMLDSAKVPSNTVPLLGDGAVYGQLNEAIGELRAVEPTVGLMTRGPVKKSDLQPPSFPAGTDRGGASGWWKTWSSDVLQDYRGFSPVHRNLVNVLMADGGVRSFTDTNKDGQLNNGFPAGNGFGDDTVELSETDCFSKAALRGF
ncbi:MAG: DUF1559 domain-containing protein [Planctomycetota bacterium]